ncbi:unnamed protein product [Aureobasidium uvarum]|uniref:Uncharacterized protein n=1 Tax=Aureobasidium uvarum TaxID=2773716 RepID=A0A9N8KA04_9PEZI|nr:unnamed protein product [Aureobasidium uvarum]
MTIAPTTEMNHNRKTAWSGKVLIPMWTMQILATLTTIAGYILFLSHYDIYNSWAYYDDYTVRSRATFAYISAVILIILWFIALFIIIFEIVRFHKKNLPAKTMLTTQIILSVFSSIAFIIEMLGLFAIIYGGYKSLLDWVGTIIATRKLSKRESKQSYGMTALDEETGQSKGDQI